MSSSNEPGYPRSGDGPGDDSATGPAGGTGPDPEGGVLGKAATRSTKPLAGPMPAQSAEDADLPPWQSRPAARAKERAAPPEASAHADGSGKTAAGMDVRLNRFIAGAPAPSGAPEANPAARGERAEAVRSGGAPAGSSAEYGSELPDLSQAPPRTPSQPKPAERPAPEQSAQVPAQAAESGKAVQVAVRQYQGPVRASMQIRRIDPWSALKVSLVLSVAMFFIWMIAVAFLYLVLGGMGVWSKLNSNVGDLLTSAGGSAGGELVSSGTIFGGAILIGLVNIVLMTAAATIGVFIYNLSTDLVGGVEVTLADRD